MSLYTQLYGGSENGPLSYHDDAIDLSNPRATYYSAFSGGPTFVTWQVQVDDSMLQAAYRAEIERAVKKSLQDATKEQVALVTEEVLAHIGDDLESSVEEKVNAAFSTLGIISDAELDAITNN